MRKTMLQFVVTFFIMLGFFGFNNRAHYPDPIPTCESLSPCDDIFTQTPECECFPPMIICCFLPGQYTIYKRAI